MTRRSAALVALACSAVTVGLLARQVVADVPRGATGTALIAVAAAATWYALVRRGVVHVVGFVLVSVVAMIAAVVLMAANPALAFGVVLSLSVAIAAARHAFRVRVPLRPAPRPMHAVVFWNPRSGGGKAMRCHLADEARSRGIEPVELTAGSSLDQLVQAAVDAGADAVAMAGGDGSQAIVARIAADRGIPYACVPAGTRNHFARDLGVDREDIVGALDAFVDGVERLVDLGEVNGRTFVNNVSLGVYGAAVQRAGYRDAKLKTVLETAASGPSELPGLRWRSPDGVEHGGGAAIVISNNAYRPGPDGARPRLDEGRLGIAAIAGPGDELVARTWTTESYEIDAPAPVPAGIDGEAVILDPPLVFGIRRRALHCRIARRHPGASPSALPPASPWVALRMLAGMAAGRTSITPLRREEARRARYRGSARTPRSTSRRAR
jgi:diacylglycerol kinase family enzyme